MNAAAVQRIYATSGDKSSDKEPVLLVEKTGGKKKNRFMPGCHNSRSERAQLQPSAPARISLLPRVCVIWVACIAVGWHGDAARPHPHDKLRAIDPCAVQIGGSVL